MTLKSIIAKFKKELRTTFQSQKNIMDVTDKYLNMIEDASTGGGSDVSVTQIQTTGTKIATITVDDTPTDLYAPTGGGSDVSVSQIQSTGTKIATITVDDTPTDLYAPATSVTQIQSTGTKIATVTVGSSSTDIYAPNASAVNYSTNEHDTGVKWIDNKTIYRRVITGTKTTNAPEVVASGLTFIDTLIKISITFKGNTSSLIGQYFESSNDNGRCWIEGNGDLYISSGTSYPVQPYTYTIIIEYTK